MVIELMPMFGREDGSEMFRQDAYWAKTLAETNGEGIFTDTDLPETASTKRFYEHIATTIENDIKKHCGSVIQKDLVARERAHVMLTNNIKDSYNNTQCWSNASEHFRKWTKQQ
jgi:hypothetical protein